nr:DUF4147 domain-containing protein [uncultured Dethiosulfovibrio sp.]
MTRNLRSDCMDIATYSIGENMPEKATAENTAKLELGDRITCLAVGKAAWSMAKGAADALGDRIVRGTIITKTGHLKGEIPGFFPMEAGHPIPDDRSLKAGSHCLELARSLKEKDHLLVLLSGGGSSLMESLMPGIGLEDLISINQALLRSGAPIDEINVIRKRLSTVKAGRLALAAHPAKVTTLILSDVLDNDLEAVASGPTMPDRATAEVARRIAESRRLTLTKPMKEAFDRETPKELPLSQVISIGDVSRLCAAACERAISLGYETILLTSSLRCEAREAGSFLASIGKEHSNGGPKAFILGGETVVQVRGEGLGGRNQELALAAAIGLRGQDGVALASIGSDGTDGPTESAGGVVDGGSFYRMIEAGIDPQKALEENDSNRALMASGDLVDTGPTGTNVNDIVVMLC